MVDSLFHAQARQRKIDEARRVREEQAFVAQVKRDRRKPAVASSFDDPAFCDRVLARAARHQKIVAEIRSGNYLTKPKASATARWKSAVAAKSATMPRAAAIMAVEKSHPGLRQKMLTEVNSSR